MDLFEPENKLLQYIESHTSPEDEVLYSLRRTTFLKAVHPRMISGPVQGKFLEMVSHFTRPSRILEIGTYTGYSAICLARGLREEGLLYTLEINDELADIQENYIKKAGLEEKIIRIVGDAREVIPSLEENFDLVFIDGEKEQYSEYYELCLPRLNPGGIIIADNVLWDGKVIDEQFRTDSATMAIKNFNSLVTNDKRTENLILPLRDGLMLIRKL